MNDWLQLYLDYSRASEAPAKFRFWAGVACISAALKRNVRLPMGHFHWYPNFYLLFVAPPGTVTKTSTIAVATSLLREAGVCNFGPEMATWQALMEEFERAGAASTFGPSSALFVESGEFGNFFDPHDRKMVDFFNTLWDNKEGLLRKQTSKREILIANPFLTFAACTTPNWLQEHMGSEMTGGGFASRCLFIVAKQKEKLVPYPSELIDHQTYLAQRYELVSRLRHIAMLSGEFQMTKAAKSWGKLWYEHWMTSAPFDKETFGGYIARKQAHIHKLAMVIAAASSSDLVLDDWHLTTAHDMVTDLEADFTQIFTVKARQSWETAILSYIARYDAVIWEDLYKFARITCPDIRSFPDWVEQQRLSGQLAITKNGEDCYVRRI